MPGYFLMPSSAMTVIQPSLRALSIRVAPSLNRAANWKPDFRACNRTLTPSSARASKFSQNNHPLLISCSKPFRSCIKFNHFACSPSRAVTNRSWTSWPRSVHRCSGTCNAVSMPSSASTASATPCLILTKPWKSLPKSSLKSCRRTSAQSFSTMNCSVFSPFVLPMAPAPLAACISCCAWVKAIVAG